MLKKHNSLLFLAKLEKWFWLFLWIYLYIGNFKKNTAIIQVPKSCFQNTIFQDSWLNWDYTKNWNAVKANFHTSACCRAFGSWFMVHLGCSLGQISPKNGLFCKLLQIPSVWAPWSLQVILYLLSTAPSWKSISGVSSVDIDWGMDHERLSYPGAESWANWSVVVSFLYP